MNINEYISSGIIEMYVMGLCSAEEKQELETLRRQHPVLHEAIVQYEKEMEEKMRQQITLPSAETDEKILKSFDSLQTPLIPIDTTYNKPRNTAWLRPVAAAAILLLLISSWFNYTLLQKNKKQEKALKENNYPGTLPLADYNVMKDPSITPVAMYGVGTHTICRCTMFWDKKTGKMYIMIHHLPKSSSSKDYQLWAIVDGNPVNVGIIQDDIRGRFIEINNVPAGAIAFSITLEKAGGNSTPTLQETYLEGKI